MSRKWRDWHPAPFGTQGHPGLVPTGYGPCLVLEDRAVVNKPMKERIPALLFPRASGSTWGARAETILVSARLGLGKGRRLCKQQCPPRDYESHRCLLPSKRRSFQPLGLQLSQQLLSIWLQQLHHIPKCAPGSPVCSSVAGRDVELGHPACSPAPCVRQRRTLRPDFHLGKNYSLSFPSDWRTHLG